MRQGEDVDISKIPQKTIKRLESIVEACDSDKTKAEFYKRICNDEKKEEYGKKFIEGEKFNWLDGKSKLEHDLIQAENYLSEGEQKKLALELYKIYIQEGEREEALYLAKKHLKLPQKDVLNLQEEILLEYMLKASVYAKPIDIHGWNELHLEEYLPQVKEMTDGLPLDKVKAVADKAYSILMKPQDRGIHNVSPDHFKAGMLAKIYELGGCKIREAGNKLLESATNPNYRLDHEDYELIEAGIKEFDLSEENIKPVLLEFIKHWIPFYLDTISEMIKKYNISNEAKPLIQKEYNDYMKRGRFDFVFEVRKSLNNLIDDNRINLDELELLDKMMGEDAYFS